MMRHAIAALCAAAFCAADAMHIQIGAAGWSRRAGQWIDGSVEIGATAGTLSSQVCAAYGWTDFGNYYYYIPLGAKKVTTSNESWTESCYVRFIPGGGLSLYAATANPDYVEVYGARRFTAAETVSLGTFGYESQYHNYAWDHAVITIRGNPYSTVMNDTDADRTVNGVLIPAKEGRALPFPIYLVMDEIENVRFFDLNSGDEISGVYYNMSGGYYRPSWTGDIRFSDGTAASTNAPLEKLVFGDMVTANEDKVLYATNDMPVRSMFVNVTTNFQLQTWWDFSHDDWGSSPKAKINDEVVCDGHSTSHIIPYTVNGNNIKVNEPTGKGYIYFTMSQTPQSGYAGGSCTMRCWDASLGRSTSAYANAPADHKAEVSAGLGVARFKLTINIYAGTWKVEPL